MITRLTVHITLYNLYVQSFSDDYILSYDLTRIEKRVTIVRHYKLYVSIKTEPAGKHITKRFSTAYHKMHFSALALIAIRGTLQCLLPFSMNYEINIIKRGYWEQLLYYAQKMRLALGKKSTKDKAIITFS